MSEDPVRDRGVRRYDAGSPRPVPRGRDHDPGPLRVIKNFPEKVNATLKAAVSADSACQAVIGAIIAGGATGETSRIEDLQIRDADAAVSPGGSSRGGRRIRGRVMRYFLPVC